MHHLISWILFSAVLLLPGALNAFLLRQTHRSWWGQGWLRTGAFLLPCLGLGFAVLWMSRAGPQADLPPMLGNVVFGLLLLQMALSGALVLTAVLQLAGRWFRKIRPRSGEPDPTRRRLLKGGLAAIPLLAAGGSLTGVWQAADQVRLPRIELGFPNLPPGLEGLRIFQLSDMHLAGFFTLQSLETLLQRAAPLEPDLVVLTGDMVDDLRLLPGALEMLKDFAPPGRLFAVLGNHEYRTDVHAVVQICEESGVPLLVDEKVTLDFQGVAFDLAGVKDPVHRLRPEKRERYFGPRLDGIFPAGNKTRFRILLSHRPDAFASAARRQIDLTLAGHTHGGQLGWNGRSLWNDPDFLPYPWGDYQLGDSRLYTSSGAGHWVPFRIGCPTEAPLVILSRTS
jgi:predicted MPP superfamily phosphohydrolase